MNFKNFRSAFALSSMLAVAFAASGCSDDGYGYSTSPTDNGNNGSYRPTVAIVTPTSGGAVSGSTLQLKIQTSYFTILAPGGAVKQGEGHVHVYVDKPASSSAYDAVIKQGAEADLAMPAAGKHYVIVSLQNNDHSPYGIQDSVAFEVNAAEPTPPTNNGGYGYGY